MLYCNPECIGNVHCPFICPYHAPMIIIAISQWTIEGMVTCSSYPKRSLLSRCIRRFVHSWLTILEVVYHERLRNLGRRIVYRLSVNQPSWYAVNGVNGGSVTLLRGNQAHFVELVNHLWRSLAVAFAQCRKLYLWHCYLTNLQYRWIAFLLIWGRFTRSHFDQACKATHSVDALTVWCQEL